MFDKMDSGSFPVSATLSHEAGLGSAVNRTQQKTPI
jgi:hypothetical protein